MRAHKSYEQARQEKKRSTKNLPEMQKQKDAKMLLKEQ